MSLRKLGKTTGGDGDGFSLFGSVGLSFLLCSAAYLLAFPSETGCFTCSARRG